MSETAVPAATGHAPLAATEVARRGLLRSSSWRLYEFVIWIAAIAPLFLLPEKLLILNEIAIMALFAISLDLILGYAGIVSLGHAAFFGFGAYVAGIAAKHGITDPFAGLALGGLLAGLLGFVTSFLVLRGSDLTRLMITLGVALILQEIANKFPEITGGADGLQGIVLDPILGRFEFDLWGRTAYVYSLTVLFICFLFARRIVHSPFGLSLRAVKDNRLRAGAVGISPSVRLVAIYTAAAVFAGVAGALLTQTHQFVSLDVLSFNRSADVMLVLVLGGASYLYGGIIGAVIFTLLQDWLANLTPHYWQFWIGLLLVAIVLVGRERLTGWWRAIPFFRSREARS